MRVLIIDDSTADRAALRLMLGRIAGLAVVGEAGDFVAAQALLRRTEADLLFLDIELGRQNGFSLIPAIPLTTLVAFVTVHSRYGARAFDVNAFDYLVKPVREDRLLRTLQKAAGILTSSPVEVDRVAVHRSGSAHRYLPLDTISAVVAEGNYSRVLSGPTLHEDHRRLRDWQSILESRGFERLDRSHLILPAMIDSMGVRGNGCVLRMRYSTIEFHLGSTACVKLREIGF